MPSYQIRQLSLGGVLDQALALTKNHLKPLLVIVIITLTPFTLLINAIVTIIAPMPVQPLNPTPEEFQVFMNGAMKTMTLLGIALIPTMLATAVCNAAVVRAISEAYLGKSFSPMSAIRQAFSRILPLFGTWFLFGLAYIFGLMLCVIPGILVLLWYSLATQIVVIEGTSGMGALNRSKALMKGNIGKYFGLLVVIGLLNFAINFVTGVIPQPHLEIVVTAAVQAVFTVFTSAAMVVFYFSTRCQHEQFDLQLLADNIGSEFVLEADDNDRSAE